MSTVITGYGTDSATEPNDFLAVYRRTVALLSQRDRIALDHALRSVTTAFAAVNSPAQAESGYPDLPDLPAAHVAAIAQGIADADAGKVRDGKAVFAEMRERLHKGEQFPTRDVENL